MSALPEKRLLDAARASSLGDEVPPDAEEVWLSRLGDSTLLVLAVVAHAHGTSAREIRRATGQLRLTLGYSLHELRAAELIEREHRPGADHWFATPAGTRLGVVPYVVRLLGAIKPLYRGIPGTGWSLGRFSSVGTEHGPPIFRPSFDLVGIDDVDALAEVLHTGLHGDRAYALTKLIALNDPRSVSILSEVAQSHGEDEPLARHAAVALGSFHTPASIETLIDLAAHRDSLVREAAARSLGRLRASAAVPTLEDLLRSYPSESVRAAAACALGRIGERSAVKSLAAALCDRDRDVGRNARHALIELGAVKALHENQLRLEPLRSLDAVRARIANK
jgi:HEAT repeat protein